MREHGGWSRAIDRSEGAHIVASPRATSAQRARRSNVSIVALALMLALGLAAGACSKEVDLGTEEGLKQALSNKEKLKEAMGELKEISGDLDKLKTYGPELNKLFVAGSEFDYEVLTYLVMLKDPAYKESYLKAIATGDTRLVPLAAGMIVELNMTDAIDALIECYNKATDMEVKRIVLEAGATLKDPKLAKLANDLLWEKGPDDVPIANLRWACRALERQADPSTINTLLRAMFYRDSVGRDINSDCTMALLAIGKPAIPEIQKMLRLENEDVMGYVNRNSDRMTKETIILGATALLGRLRAKEAKDDLLGRVQDPTPIVPPGVLAVKPTSDMAWVEWANLIGQVYQEMLFSLNDIGVEGDENMKAALIAMYQWAEPYPTKFKKPVEFVNMIEVSVRVNAALVLAANDYTKDEATLQIVLQTLKDPEFNNDRKLRPAARASIAQDVVTYLGIVSEPGWTDTVWKFFNDMIAVEFADKPDAKIVFDFVPVRTRIAAMEATYKVADECVDNPKCYAKYVEKTGEENHFQKIKGVFELGRMGSHDDFDLILKHFGEFDPFGVMFAADALARLGKAEDAPKVEALIKELKATRDEQSVRIFEGYLKPLRFTLLNKQ